MIIKKYLKYLKDNPEGYWFKRKLYGFGWVPVKWQGWAVILISVAIIIVSAIIGDRDDAPGLILLGFLIGFGLIFFFGFWKGEKLRWQWGEDKKSHEDKDK